MADDMIFVNQQDHIARQVRDASQHLKDARDLIRQAVANLEHLAGHPDYSGITDKLAPQLSDGTAASASDLNNIVVGAKTDIEDNTNNASLIQLMDQIGYY